MAASNRGLERGWSAGWSGGSSGVAGARGGVNVLHAPAAPGRACGALRNKRLGPALGGSDLRFSLDLPQIRLTVPATRPSVRVLVADRQQYMEHDTLHVLLQSARGSDKAFEQARYRKSARLQQRRRADGSWLAARADNGWSGCGVLGTAKLTWVSLPARSRPHSVLLCVLTPCLSSMAQPDLRLHSVCGRGLSDAAFEAAFDGCYLAALGRSLAARRSSRRPPWCHRGGRLHWRRATFEVRTAVDRRACCPGLPGRSNRTHYRAGGPLEPL